MKAINIKQVTHLDVDTLFVHRLRGYETVFDVKIKKYYVHLFDGQIKWRVRVWPRLEKC